MCLHGLAWKIYWLAHTQTTVIPSLYPPLNLSLCSIFPQITKVSTTAPGPITTTSLRAPPRPRLRPPGTWATHLPQGPRARLWGAWSTTTTLGNTTRPRVPATCPATQTSSRSSTPGTRPAPSPVGRDPCRASPARCVAPARPSHPSPSTAVHTATSSRTRPQS